MAKAKKEVKKVEKVELSPEAKLAVEQGDKIRAELEGSPEDMRSIIGGGPQKKAPAKKAAAKKAAPKKAAAKKAAAKKAAPAKQAEAQEKVAAKKAEIEAERAKREAELAARKEGKKQTESNGEESA